MSPRGQHARALGVAAASALALVSSWALARATRPPLRAGAELSQAVYDRDGQLLRLTLAGDQSYRLWLPLEAISPAVIEATLLHEDRHFRRHFGINPIALARAFWQTYVARGRRLGGSTLTMQLARLKLGLDSRTPWGKLRQILGALELEALYDKDEILEAYLNLVPYGGNIEGVGAASLIYFHKEAARLTLAEALTLAVIPQSPSRRSLKSGPAREPLRIARSALHERWREENPAIQGDEAEMAMPISTHQVADLPFRAPHLSEAVVQRDPVSAVIRTTLDPSLQKLVERQTRSYLKSNRRLGIRNAVVMIVDHAKMEVRALLGSADYFDSSIQGQVNGARAKRSPGSALKPFVYALAIDQGLIHPQTMLKDTPVSYGAYDPENFDREFQGPLSATNALIRSRNVPALELASRLRAPGFYEFLKSAGITRLREEKFYGLSVALGGAEVTMEEAVSLYAALAEDGVQRPLRYRADDPEQAEGTRLLSPEAAYVTVNMLHKNQRPNQAFRQDWTRDQVSMAWKTGTSHGFRDAWSIGIYGGYVISVWLGNFDGKSNPNLIGRDAAGPLLFEIADAIRASDREFDPSPPLQSPAVAKVHVCPVSGDLPGPFCKAKTEALYIPGKSPIRTCAIHRAVEVDARSGRRICRQGRAPARTEVFEFWPSDLLSLFARAGIPRRAPPPFEAGCAIQDLAQRGVPPSITSPKKDLAYALRSSVSQSVPLLAVTDADVHELHWFSGEEYLGKSPRLEPLFWKPRPGRHLIRVVDDLGRSDSREISVMQVE
ncbi:MAG TPA: penicillin-binding protein 1C [Bdellovibrionota bacterium]|nr:penicillin-binding protein 1C [Bdellovibrionota bacterium]